MNDIARRDILRTLALGAGTVALSGAGTRRAFAQPTLPKRVCFINTPHGVPEQATGYDDLAKMTSGTTDFTLGFMTEPLAPHKADMVVIESIRMFNQRHDTHAGGYIQALTGAPLTGDQPRPTNISIDQYLGEKIGRKVTPAWPVLNTGVQASGCSWLGDGTRARANIDPYDVYGKLFANLVPANGAPAPAVIDGLARKKSILDAVAKNVASFQRRLPKEDRARADAQLDAIRTLEQRLSAGTTTVSAKCSKPQQVEGIRPQDAAKAPELTRLHFDIIFNALACDLTRFVNFTWRGDGNQVYKCPFEPINQPGQDFHGCSHNNPRDDFRSFKAGKRWLFGFVAELATRLKSVPEGDGTMLDNTLIVCWSEIQRGHDNRKLQWFTIGGKNMGVNRGQYMLMNGRRSDDNQWPHTRFLVGVLNAAGLPDQTFGDIPEWGRGPLPGFLRS